MKINLLTENVDWKKDLQEGFRTEKLIFQIFSERDLAQLLEISCDKELFRYLDDIKHPRELKEWLRSVYQKRNYLFFTIRGRVQNDYNRPLLGAIMLKIIKFNTLEVGGWLGENFRNKGFGSEAASGIVRWLNQKAPDRLLIAKTREDNHAALRILDVEGIIKKVTRRHRDHDSEFFI